MKKILFLIHDLGQGGAEKVLVNLVNNMDRSKFDISVTTLFGGGVNEQFLAPDIHFRTIFPREVPGNSHLMKLLTPRQLHHLCVRERYDIEVSYLEGPSARVISGCDDPDTKLVCWIHSTFPSKKEAAKSFRSYGEALMCYQHYQSIACVSCGILNRFIQAFPTLTQCCVLYNTVESDRIRELAVQPIQNPEFENDEIKLIGVGSLKPIKGFDRLIRIHKELRAAGHPIHTYILGKGPDQAALQHQAVELGVEKTFTFLGYDTNPYKYVGKSDLFVCSSMSEGFSTATTEALIVGIPVCTVEVSGMKEMLGEHNEYGIVTENEEEALYQGIKKLLDTPGLLAYYTEKARERGMDFSTERTVRAVEEMLEHL